MIKKATQQKARQRKEPLGKGLSDIMLKAGCQKHDVPYLSQTPTQETLQCHATESVGSDNSSNDREKGANIKMIGLILRRGREQKGLTLERVSSDLCLRVSLLNSVEAGDWGILPHEVYVRGYVRKYADLLGIQSEIEPCLAVIRSQKSFTKQRDRAGQTPTRNFLIFRRPGKAPTAMFLYAVAIALMLGFFIVAGERKQGVEMSKLENAVQVSNSVTEIDAKRNIPDLIDTKKLMITCHERTWIAVIIDGTEKKEFMLKPQEVVILNAKEKFDLLVGNAGGVRLLLDGKDTSFSGENGQVKRVTLS